MATEKTHDFDEAFFTSVFNQLTTNVFIKDAGTDVIVYMNDAMKREFGLIHPEGKRCWQILQKGLTEKCPYCSQRDKKAGFRAGIRHERNTLTGRIYKHYDTLTEWCGRTYCVCNFVDVTEYEELSEAADFDDLTGIYNRRAGREKLAEIIEDARSEKKTLTVALIDVNELKKINDQYGHGEGDNLLSSMAHVTKGCLGERDLIFRLSGDEFVLVFYAQNQQEAEIHMREISGRLHDEREKYSIFYEATFSFGLTEVYPGDRYTLSDIIRRADEQMYIQKREYHIMRAREELTRDGQHRMEAKQFVYDKEHLYEALASSTEDYIFVGNMKTGTFRYSPAMVEEFGLPGEIVENAAAFWSGLIHPNDEKGFLESNQEIADGRTDSHNIEYRARNTRGEWIWLRCRGRMIKDTQGRPDLFAGMITNLGKKSQMDHMTGLYNRFEFEGNIKKYMVDYPDLQQMQIMILDMDAFKNINDLFDRAFGDEVLRITAQRISSILPPNARVYRLDGDEFGIIILNGEEEDYLRIFNSIQHKFHGQQEYNGKKYYCTVSGGCAVYPTDADNYLDLLKCANYSLEHSKLEGKDRITRFSEDILQEKERKLELAELLRESIDRGFAGFSISYQPQVDSETGTLYGAEALARWRCAKYGNVSPGEFIPLLEQSGLIVPLGSWVLYHAVEQCRKWCELKPDFHMSINLSYRQLLEGDIVSNIQETLEALHVQPGNVTLELTETYLIKEDAGTRDILEKMKRMGINLAMDDFGIGYSSLFSLKNIPVDIVKIDRGFVKGITSDLFNATFVRAITELCHDVGKKVCLEGVETKEEYDVVKNSGLELIQGFYFGYPINAEMFEKQWL
ncbi:bifunctional diguanylate cyclase/phosphodiesterase [Eisenbergiella sp.]